MKFTPLPATPPTFTTTFPVVAPVGTDVAMLVEVQLVVVAGVPLNVTVPEDPKLVPVIVTAVPTGPEVVDRLVIFGDTAKVIPLLATPPTVTTTFPVVAPAGTDVAMLVEVQLVVVAGVPLNVTVPEDPKLVPVIVTAVPTGPDVGFRLVIEGGGADVVTVKFTPLLAIPPTVTTTFPVVAPVGTDVAMLVEVQLVVAAGVPLNVTVPEDPKLVPVIVTAVPTGPEVVDRLVIFGDTVEVPPLNAIAACSQEVAVHVVFHIFVAATLVLFSLSANFTSVFPIRCP